MLYFCQLEVKNPACGRSRPNFGIDFHCRTFPFNSGFSDFYVNFQKFYNPHGISFFCLFQFFQNLVRAHTAGQQLLNHTLGFSLLSFFSDLSIGLCLLCFQSCHFFFSLLQSRLLLFQVSLQSVDVCGDGCVPPSD